MNIKIKSLKIENFKGIEKLNLDFDGKDVDIRGKNGTGKTSVYDAFCWCLFGKNSLGETSFDVKPINAERGADISVDCELDVDGRIIKYSRKLHEKWKTAPGTKSAVYVGDETSCAIDDVPKKVNEYKAAVSLLIGDDGLFRLLTIHGAFMGMHWEERRKHLMAIVGGSPDSEILSKPEFSEVRSILAGKSVEDVKKRLSNKLKDYNAELNEIPIRIDEARKLAEGMTEAEYKELLKEKGLVQSKIDSINSQMAGGVEAFKAASDLINAEREIAKRQMMVINRVNMKNIEARRKHEQELSTEMSACESFLREIKSLKAELEEINAEIAQKMEHRETLLAEWHMVDDQPYKEPEVNKVCPYCGQELPIDKITEIRVNMANEFYKNRDTQLDEISENGKRVARQIASLQNEYQNVQGSLDNKTAIYNQHMAKYEKLSKVVLDEDDPKADPEYIASEKVLAELKSKMDCNDAEATRKSLMEERQKLEGDLAEYNTRIAVYQQAVNARKIIEEIEARQAEVGSLVATIEGQKEKLRLYTLAVCDAVEEKINSKFHNIRWKLFRELKKEDAIEQCCDATVGGVVYGRGLNNAACINAGIEIIKVLQDEYNIHAPCFVDNAEAVNNLAYTGGQMIKLTVSNDNELVMFKED